jgi:alanyl-tRNA synthetase
LASAAKEQEGVKQVVASFSSRGAAELRMLAEELKRIPALVAFLASYDGQKVSLLVTCGEGAKKDARQLLTAALSQVNGRGGGDARLAQGGGAATEDQYQEFLRSLDSLKF